MRCICACVNVIVSQCDSIGDSTAPPCPHTLKYLGSDTSLFSCFVSVCVGFLCARPGFFVESNRAETLLEYLISSVGLKIDPR